MRTLITGIAGQTGSYLTDFLIDIGCNVYGCVRKSTDISRISNYITNPKLKLYYGDITDILYLREVIEHSKPDIIFNLVAQSRDDVSFKLPEYTTNVNGMVPLRILETIKLLNPKIRFLQASSSEMFGSSSPPYNEKTSINPLSPYATAKAFAHSTVKNYRILYNIFACNAICFNHESKRRGNDFVTRKITKAAVNIKLGLQDTLYLGNIDTYRDWGHAKDYAKAMYMIVNNDIADDFIVSSGEIHSVREFLEISFSLLNLDPYKYLKIDEKLYRISDNNYVLGDNSKIKSTLNWQPVISFKEIIKEMIDNDLQLAIKERGIKNEECY